MDEKETAVTLAEHEHEIGSLKHRMDKMESLQNTIQELAISVKELATNMQSMIREQERHAKAIEALEQKPATRWEQIITVAITAIVTYVMTQIL